MGYRVLCQQKRNSMALLAMKTKQNIHVHGLMLVTRNWELVQGTYKFPRSTVWPLLEQNAGLDCSGLLRNPSYVKISHSPWSWVVHWSLGLECSSFWVRWGTTRDFLVVAHHFWDSLSLSILLAPTFMTFRHQAKVIVNWEFCWLAYNLIDWLDLELFLFVS